VRRASGLCWPHLVLQYSLRNIIKKLLSLDGQPTVGRKLAVLPRRTDRRRMLLGLGSTVGLLLLHTRRVHSAGAPLRFALTPVLLTSDLVMLEELKAYLARATERPVHLVTRRTYQEITALLVSRQVDAAWICGYPFVAFRDQLALVARASLERKAALPVLSDCPA